ncbi:MAG TPA: hypothetical protein VFJ16_00450 [Longimicrobium sp.]|nr:hypothetical protein [Longimicrobium sp.]
MALLGFSTGSVARADFRAAVATLRGSATSAIELSALRADELGPLLEAYAELDLSPYRYVSVHAPSAFALSDEPAIARALLPLAHRGIPIVVHPDTIHQHALWRPFGRLLLVENMDPRKPAGRTAAELAGVFAHLPEASLCFDIAHARRYDTSMLEAYRILSCFGGRLAQVHISELDSDCRHRRISPAAIRAYREVSALIPRHVPVIIESDVAAGQVDAELAAARDALGWNRPRRARLDRPGIARRGGASIGTLGRARRNCA